jgi:predicted DNA-binding transcriptional regulator AlpA
MNLPPELRWVSADAVAEMLGYSVSHFRQRIACRPDFPLARTLGQSGDPRWNVGQVNAWMLSQPVRDFSRRRVVVDAERSEVSVADHAG